MAGKRTFGRLEGGDARSLRENARKLRAFEERQILRQADRRRRKTKRWMRRWLPFFFILAGFALLVTLTRQPEPAPTPAGNAALPPGAVKPATAAKPTAAKPTAAVTRAGPFDGPYLSEQSGIPYIVDGDTVHINGYKIRLFGIDAPEQGQTCTDENGNAWRCGVAATTALAGLIGGHPVTCRQKDTDRYDREVSVCTLNGLDINRWMVREGWAVAYTRYSFAYEADESRARQEHDGIWAGTFENPETWRHSHPHHRY